MSIDLVLPLVLQRSQTKLLKTAEMILFTDWISLLSPNQQCQYDNRDNTILQQLSLHLPEVFNINRWTFLSSHLWVIMNWRATHTGNSRCLSHQRQTAKYLNAFPQHQLHNVHSVVPTCKANEMHVKDSWQYFYKIQTQNCCLMHQCNANTEHKCQEQQISPWAHYRGGGHTKKQWDDGTTGQFMPVNWPFASPFVAFTTGQTCNEKSNSIKPSETIIYIFTSYLW